MNKIENLRNTGLWLTYMVCSLAALTTNAQLCIPETFKLIASDGYMNDRYGHSVAISGETVVVGSFMDDEFGQNSGSVYIYDTRSGKLVDKLFPDAYSANDNFGYSVSIDGTTVIIGSPTDDEHGTDAGSAYIFDSQTGELVAKIYSDQNYSTEHFGISVGVSNYTAIVGAPRSYENGSYAGAAYVYDTRSGKQEAKLLPELGAAYNMFGRSVAISGMTAIVGATNPNDYYDSTSGGAYLFDILTGEQISRLTPPGIDKTDGYGMSVAINGTAAIVGAPFDDDIAENTGAAYLFNIITMELIAKLTPPDGAAHDSFGKSVSISGTTVAVGAPLNDSAGPNTGSIYLFSKFTGELIAQYSASDSSIADQFGNSVAIYKSTVVAGAIGDDDNGLNSGSVYVHDINDPQLCIADFVADCTLDILDIAEFFDAFNDHDLQADINIDGDFNFFDISTFLTAFAAGCP